MSDLEFDILDELYFVTHFDELKEATNISLDNLRTTLIGLRKKGWIKVYESMSEEMSDTVINIEEDFQHYFYLASKEGLLAHNGH